MAISISNRGQTSFTVTASAQSTPTMTRYWYLYIDGSLYGSKSNMSQTVEFSVAWLEPGTTYYVEVQYSNGTNTWSAGSTTATTLSPSPPPTPSGMDTESHIPLGSLTDSSVVIRIRDATTHTGTRYWRLTLSNGISYTAQTSATTVTSDYAVFTISGLQPSTTYSIWSVTYGTSRAGDTEYIARLSSSSPTSFTTLAAITYLWLPLSVSATATTFTITATITEAHSAHIYVDFQLEEWTQTSSSYSVSAQKTLLAGNTTISYTFTGVPSATVFRASITDNNDRGAIYPNKVRTKNNFSWATSKVSGGVFNLTATEWNNFTSQLKAKEKYYTTTDDRTFTTAVTGRNFTATMANQAINATNNIRSSHNPASLPTLSTVSTGGRVTAKFLNDLVTHLNS